MDQKSPPKRRPVKTAPRIAARRLHRCSRNGSLTAPTAADIHLEPESIAASPSHGRVEVVETYFDAAGKPIKRKGLGAARIARCYDENGHQVEESYFNVEGKPTMREDLGAARIAWRYDASGKEVEAAMFDLDGAPVAPPHRKRAHERA